MFDEPEGSSEEREVKPLDRARERADEFRMHAELAAVFEGTRKFEAQIYPNLSADVAREVQRGMGRLDKARPGESGVLPAEVSAGAEGLLGLYQSKGLSTNDYHVYRRPGEVLAVRWIRGEQVESFYERLQAHFDTALEGYREEERQMHGWKQDPKTLEYLAALDAMEVRMAERYRREMIRGQGIFVLSTQTADELNIQYLTESIMAVAVEELVGAASAAAEGEEVTERDLTWFYKLFLLRGMVGGEEGMCFFMFLQKTDEW